MPKKIKNNRRKIVHSRKRGKPQPRPKDTATVNIENITPEMAKAMQDIVDAERESVRVLRNGTAEEASS
jgi:hypothetical protein